MEKSDINYTADDLSLAPKTEFFEEDERAEVIKELFDDEEIDASIELIKEKYDMPVKDTISGEPEPKKTDEVEDTSEKKPEDKTETEKKVESDQSTETDKKEEKKPEEEPAKTEAFVLTDEIIQKQPEEYREILSKYKDKGKEDLIKAAANAVALKSTILKDNEKAITALAESFKDLSDEEVLNTLIKAQAEVGATEKPEVKTETQKQDEVKIELPSLPENDERVQSILSKETVARLKKKGYTDIPEDLNSEDYKEWERDLQDKGGLRKVEQFLSDLKQAESSVKTELQKVVYAQTNLQNLFVESPGELLPILTDENLPKLKKLNDDSAGHNNKVLEEEVTLINKELEKLGVTPEDLGIDLSLKKEQSGLLFNPVLNDLMYNGNQRDPNIIGTLGKVAVLKKGQLVKKFLFEHNPKILTALVSKQSQTSKKEVERLKDDALNTLGASKNAGKTVINAENIQNVYDDAQLDKLAETIRSKYN
jgi:hypothetical protein